MKPFDLFAELDSKKAGYLTLQDIRKYTARFLPNTESSPSNSEAMHQKLVNNIHAKDFIHSKENLPEKIYL